MRRTMTVWLAVVCFGISAVNCADTEPLRLSVLHKEAEARDDTSVQTQEVRGADVGSYQQYVPAPEPPADSTSPREQAEETGESDSLPDVTPRVPAELTVPDTLVLF